MNPLDDFILNSLLRTDTNNQLFQKEDLNVEYKLNFDRGSKEAKAQYCKEIVALYNCEGGYLFFGINDKTFQIEGLTDFSDIDNADLSNDLNTYFSPTINFQSRQVSIDNKIVFAIYVQKRLDIPSVCIKDHQSTLKSGIIYWRYPGKSSPIEAGDLIQLLNSLKNNENSESSKLISRDIKAKHKPYLNISGQSSQNSIFITITSEKFAILNSINVISGEVQPLPYSKLPLKLGNYPLKIPINTFGKPGINIKYKLEFLYSDQIQNHYRVFGICNGPAVKLNEPEEII